MSRPRDPVSVVVALLRGDPTADRAVPPSGTTGHLTGIAAAAMAALAVVALTLAIAAERVADRWAGALSGTTTLELPAGAPDLDADRAVAILLQTPGILRAERLGGERIRRLLEPWFGDTSALPDGALPRLLAIEEGPGLDREALVARLEGELPGAVYHRHDVWSDRFARAASRVRMLAWGFALTALGVTAIVVTLAARAALAIHAGVIETLRLIGARDNYIVRAFVRRFSLRAAAGALIGTVIGLVVLRGLSAGHEQTLGGLMPSSPGAWLLVALVPVLNGLLAFVATRRSALRVLMRVS